MAKKNSGSIDFPPQSAAKPVEEKEAVETSSPKVEHGVSNFYGPEALDATPKEIRQKYRETVTLAEGHAVSDMNEQRERVQQVSKEYFAALRADQKSRGMGSKVLEDLTGLEGNKKSTKLLRDEWLRARAQFAFTQSEALEERLKNRPKTREDILEGLKYKGRESLDEAKVRARYERMVTVRTVVMGAEEAELAVKMEGFNSRDKKSIDRFYDWYKKQPPAVRIFGTSAAILSLTTGAGVLLGGSMIGLAPLGMLGVSASLRFFAEKNTNKNVRLWLNGLAVLPSIGAAFGTLMNYGATRVHGALGTEEKAREMLKKNERLGMLSNLSNLENISQKRKKSLMAKETIARHGRWARIAGSLGAGALFSQVFGHASSHESTGATVSSDAATGAPPISHEGTADTTHPTSAEVLTPEHTPVLEPFSATVQPGEGMDHLFVELREHYAKLYPDATDPSVPPGIRHLLEAKSANELSRELNFVDQNNASYVMKEGDSLSFTEDGLLVFTPESDPTAHVVLLGNHEDGSLETHALSSGEQRGHFLHHSVSALHESSHTESHAPVVTSPNDSHVTAQLNRDALTGHAVAAHETSTEVSSSSETSPVSDDENITPAPPENIPAPVVPPATPAHSEVVPVSSETHESVEAPAPIEAGLPFFNNHDVEVAPSETHTYAAADDQAPGGEQLIVFGGGDARDESFLSRVQEVARANPGKKVYFDAGYLVDYNGVPQKWINAAVYDPESGMSLGVTPEGPEMIGVINPDSFINKVN